MPQISKDEVDFLSEYAKFFFETGQYSDALQALRCYIALVPYAERFVSLSLISLCSILHFLTKPFRLQRLQMVLGQLGTTRLQIALQLPHGFRGHKTLERPHSFKGHLLSPLLLIFPILSLYNVLVCLQRDVFESNGSVQFKLLGQRTWWLHWSIFTLFFQPDYALELLEIYFKTE